MCDNELWWLSTVAPAAPAKKEQDPEGMLQNPAVFCVSLSVVSAASPWVVGPPRPPSARVIRTPICAQSRGFLKGVPVASLGVHGSFWAIPLRPRLCCRPGCTQPPPIGTPGALLDKGNSSPAPAPAAGFRGCLTGGLPSPWRPIPETAFWRCRLARAGWRPLGQCAPVS